MPGHFGTLDTEDGAFANTTASDHVGVFGKNDATADAAGGGAGGAGVFGLTASPNAAGVFGANLDASRGRGVQGNGPEAGVGGYSDRGFGVLAQSGNIGIKAQAPTAGHFEGNVEVTGDITLLGQGSDCAEDFDASETMGVEPGTVMVLDSEGGLRVSDVAYDSRVAGVVSGAGAYRPAMILGRQPGRENRLPLALMGKVFCKVDATDAPISVGDLLTTSSTPGHAMKATDRDLAFGAVLGKALLPSGSSRGLIPILVALQ